MTHTTSPNNGDAERALVEAVRKLVKAKGRYHTEQNYKALTEALEGYDAARRSPVADAAGELPVPTCLGMDFAHAETVYGYTAEQVRQAQRDAVATDRRARGMLAMTEQEGVAGLRPYEFAVCGKSLRWYLKADVDALLARQSAPVGAPVRQSTPLADLWIHEDMERDAMEAALSAPRKDLKAAHKQAVEDAIYWKRRALTAEAAAPTSASAQPTDKN